MKLTTTNITTMSKDKLYQYNVSKSVYLSKQKYLDNQIENEMIEGTIECIKTRWTGGDIEVVIEMKDGHKLSDDTILCILKQEGLEGMTEIGASGGRWLSITGAPDGLGCEYYYLNKLAEMKHKPYNTENESTTKKQ